ncbi:unnamed protein product [Citrullus colocynthis]|uniref:Uncharacterized protein n=1 Tax=Citrullus colocynthis TaxID=252529 RepID=A0ABP0Z4K5_9ROSI
MCLKKFQASLRRSLPLLNFSYKLFQGHHVPDIPPPSPFEQEDALNAELGNSPFGKRLMHSLTAEFRTLNDVIDRASSRKREAE